MARERILVVDDESEIRDVITTVLEMAGYETVTARNGHEAMETLLSSEDRLPAAIILDFVMPVMDGVEFRLKQRSDPALSHIPVILMTANNLVIDAAQDLGVLCILPKPFESARMLASVDLCVRRGRRTSDINIQ